MKKKVTIAIFIAFLCVFIYAFFNLFTYSVESISSGNETRQLKKILQDIPKKEQTKSNETITSIADPISGNSAESIPDDTEEAFSFEVLYQINPDFVFWINIPDTKIDNPVVYRDNEYYLSHSFYKKNNGHGCIFLDEACNKDDGFLVLHGHHMKDGSMFTGLDKFKNDKFRKGHIRITITTAEGPVLYDVFAGMLADQTVEDPFDYTTKPSGDTWDTYFSCVKQNAFFFTETPKQEDNLLILSTCSYGTKDQRLVIFAKKEAE